MYHQYTSLLNKNTVSQFSTREIDLDVKTYSIDNSLVDECAIAQHSYLQLAIALFLSVYKVLLSMRAREKSDEHHVESLVWRDVMGKNKGDSVIETDGCSHGIQRSDSAFRCSVSCNCGLFLIARGL